MTDGQKNMVRVVQIIISRRSKDGSKRRVNNSSNSGRYGELCEMLRVVCFIVRREGKFEVAGKLPGE